MQEVGGKRMTVSQPSGLATTSPEGYASLHQGQELKAITAISHQSVVKCLCGEWEHL